MLLNKIISSEKDLVGVVLYGTAKSQNKSDFKHVYVLQVCFSKNVILSQAE
jgi:ATP-dependent DNA helicase 2 subunit 1